MRTIQKRQIIEIERGVQFYITSDKYGALWHHLGEK